MIWVALYMLVSVATVAVWAIVMQCHGYGRGYDEPTPDAIDARQQAWDELHDMERAWDMDPTPVPTPHGRYPWR